MIHSKLQEHTFKVSEYTSIFFIFFQPILQRETSLGGSVLAFSAKRGKMKNRSRLTTEALKQCFPFSWVLA